jgi:hypothetical protein
MRSLRPAIVVTFAVFATGATLADSAPRTAPPAPGSPGLFRFTRLNHAYSEPATAIDPIAEGPLTIRLSSPRNKLVLVANTLRLEPGVDGSHTADLEVQFFGKGWVVADVDVSGVAQRFQEEVVVPRQTRRLEGRVRVARTAGGYLLTPERLPRQIPVAVQSRLGNDIVGLCERLASLPFSELDCSGLARALSTAAVPLPPAGEGFYLATTDLTAEERRQLESYLAGTRRSGPRPAARP